MMQSEKALNLSVGNYNGENLMSSTVDNTISHHTLSKIAFGDSTKQLVHHTKQRLMHTTNLFLPLSETLSLLEELSEFELGRFLLHNKGLNGYWTSYIFRNKPLQSTHPLEDWLLNKSLLVLARERFFTFQREIKNRLKSNACFASIPCGLMDDLLLLDYSRYENISLVGIDADLESLKFANENARNLNKQEQLSFLLKDAWNLGIQQEFDLIVSNGLNMYESNTLRLVQLYKNFYQAVKPGGSLIVSFLPPPAVSQNIEDVCKKFKISIEDWKKERAIFSDIIQIQYLNFCTEEDMKKQLEQAGFKIEKIVYNEQGAVPVAIATRSN